MTASLLEFKLRIATVLALVVVAARPAATAGPVPPSQPPAVAPLPPDARFKQVGPGLFQLGQIVLNSTERTLSFPAAVNMQEGLVEYLLVSSQGKLHESVLKTEVEPYHLHLGMLLLNAKGAPKAEKPPDPAKPMPGDPILITVSWEDNGESRRVSGEDLVWDKQGEEPMEKGQWTYTGSRVIDGTFLAQRDRSIIAIIGDPDALVNNPRPRHELDENWRVNAKTCPPVDTPVKVVIHLKSEKKTAQAPR